MPQLHHLPGRWYVLAALVISFIFGPRLIVRYGRVRAGQPIREDSALATRPRSAPQPWAVC